MALHPQNSGSELRNTRSAASQRSVDLSPANIIAATAAVLAISAYVNHRLARRAERENPPAGKFLRVGGVRLHYIERGTGRPLVLLHGNGSMIQDFQSSGLLDLAATKYRVIAFDRPGYGHSDRPRDRLWTHRAQSDLIRAALARIGVERAIVLGHSWGCSVAVALARQHPEIASGLVLASGYYYPTARADAAIMSGPTVPVIGDVVRYSIAPVLARLAWPAMLRKLFGPRPVPAKFAGFPKSMAVRPSQIRASAEEAALMIPDAFASRCDYSKLRLPVTIISGTEDRLVDPRAQSARLHRDIPRSSLQLVPGAGHMVHQTDTGAVMAAIDQVAGSLDRGPI